MKILIISGSRADTGALIAVKEALIEAGQEVKWIDLAPLPQDDREHISRCVSTVIVEVTAELGSAPTDLVLLLGDRYEILGAAVAAFLMGKPIAHLSGGDVTEGSQDDSMRHAITKLSHIHFVTCAESASRLLQMGEEPWRVYNVGCPGVDTLLGAKLLNLKDTLGAAGLPDDQDFMLVAFHPNTLGDTAAEVQQLMGAVMTLLYRGINMAFVTPNMDLGRSFIDQRFSKFTALHSDRSVYLRSPSRTLFLSLMKHCTAFIGNSSAGFYEAPYFGTPVINVGDRQKGRRVSPNITNCTAESGHIFIAAHRIRTSKEPRQAHTPYGRGNASKLIAKLLGNLNTTPVLLQKKFNTQWPSIQSGSEYILPVSGVSTPKKTWSGGLQSITTAQLPEPMSDSLT